MYCRLILQVCLSFSVLDVLSLVVFVILQFGQLIDDTHIFC